MEAITRKIRAGIKKVMPGHLPDFMIIGAQKSATTSLHYYLSQHPALIGSRPKEVHFFDWDENYAKGMEWYRHNFPNTKPFARRVRYFESSPSYLYGEDVPGRIRQMNGKIQFIVLLRDPVKRAFSAWNMYEGFLRKGQVKKFLLDPFPPGKPNPVYDLFYRGRRTFPGFREAIDLELQLIKEGGPSEPSIFRRGLYARQLSHFLEHFDRSQFHIVGFKELVTGLEKSLEEVYRFLEVPPFPFEKLNVEPYNKGEYQSVMRPEDTEYVEALYKESNEELFGLLGRRINW